MYVCTQQITQYPIYTFLKGLIPIAQPVYAIMRFAKYKGPEISRIEAHNERTKETYASNPDIDTSRSPLNFHLIEPKGHYRQEAERQIFEAKCRTRTDSVRLVETLITGSPAFFKGKTREQIREYFQHALAFLLERQDPKTFISAVVHMDEKTPHMHVTFVPLTEDGRLSAKDIIGNRKKLTQWQDDYWQHMVSKYPELERGQSASETGRDHIPTRIFKDMTILRKQRRKLESLLESITPFNGRAKAREIGELLDRFIPNVERMHTQLKQYETAFTETVAENAELRKKNEVLAIRLDAEHRENTAEQLKAAELQAEYRQARALLDRIPREVLEEYRPKKAVHLNRDDEGR